MYVTNIGHETFKMGRGLRDFLPLTDSAFQNNKMHKMKNEKRKGVLIF